MIYGNICVDAAPLISIPNLTFDEAEWAQEQALNFKVFFVKIATFRWAFHFSGSSNSLVKIMGLLSRANFFVIGEGGRQLIKLIIKVWPQKFQFSLK